MPKGFVAAALLKQQVALFPYFMKFIGMCLQQRKLAKFLGGLDRKSVV